MQDKFLQQVADYYLRRADNLANLTFVFPNRRSALFMRRYMNRAIDADPKLSAVPRFMPRMVSITYFTQMFDKSALATPTELAFILYRTYCSLLPDADLAPDFDRFYFWATIIINDFNEVDSYMVDASQLYRNLKDLKEIRSNYLTPEQIEVIKYLWGDDAAPVSSDDFWQHFNPGDATDTATAKYVQLWQLMGPLYQRFVQALDSMPTPLSYSGLQSRRAYETVKDMSAADFGGRKFVFVGFSVLSTSRALMFRRLRDLGIADFFWDVASPLIRTADGTPTSSGRFILPIASKLKMPADFELDTIDTMPKIEIIAVPSNFGQVKVASSILERWAKEGATVDRADRMAVVMADEQLLTPMLYAIPPSIDTINVTMGISYSSTPFAALMSSIISLHLRARMRQDSFYYFYQDVVEVLSHPHISLIAHSEAEALKSRLLNEHIYTISANEIVGDYPALAFIFRQIDDDRDIRQLRCYIDGLISHLRASLQAHMSPDHPGRYYEIDILQGYADEVQDLCALIERYGIVVRERTFLQMIERALNLTPVAFSGEPLKGLQIMGVSDTRAIDFDRIIFTSLNERTFPRRNYNPSFIPMSLRGAYGLPTQEHEESSNAYQFYRLISRAKEVKLLYDSRTAGVTSGEMSRYLSQLLYLEKDANVKVSTAELRAEAEEGRVITVDKTPLVLAELRRFFPGGDLKISASALKTYLTCPLKFYLEYVKGLRPDNEVLEYIDASSYGTVIHAVAQRLYERHLGQVINEHVIDIMLHEDVDSLALEILNDMYYKGRYANRLSHVPGEGQIIARVIARYVRYMLIKEKAKDSGILPFRFVGGEVGEHVTHQWAVNDKYTINFTMSIDRIDSFRSPLDLHSAALRFVDYKTGADSLSFKSVDKLFTDKGCGGIFQLLLYCHAYASPKRKVVRQSVSTTWQWPEDGFDGVIKPMIYKMQTIPKEGIVDLKMAGEPIEDYRQVSGFYERLEELFDHIFEVENAYPFAQTPCISSCLYCPFTQLCGRYPEKIKH